jgi:predicted nucleotidyltransferase
MLNIVGTAEWADFCTRHALSLVVLFGSQATGAVTSRSDLDLAVLTTREDADVDYRESVWEDLLRLLQRGDVDLVFLNHAAPLLAYRVATTGKVLFEARPCLFRDFVLLALKKHWDAKKFYDLKHECLLRFLKRNRGGGHGAHGE